MFELFVTGYFLYEKEVLIELLKVIGIERLLNPNGLKIVIDYDLSMRACKS